MIEKYIIAIGGISGLMLVWVVIQGIWRRVFTDQIIDQDVLAGRSDCGSCGCATPCSVKQLQGSKNKK